MDFDGIYSTYDNDCAFITFNFLTFPFIIKSDDFLGRVLTRLFRLNISIHTWTQLMKQLNNTEIFE